MAVSVQLGFIGSSSRFVRVALLPICPVPYTAGQPVQLGVEPSNCVITKLKIDKSRKRILERRNRSAEGAKGKFSERDVMGDVD